MRATQGLHPRRAPDRRGVFVREDQLIDGLNAFLSQHVFGAYRRALLDTTAAAIDPDARRDDEERVAALRRAIGDTDQRIKRTIRSLELELELDPDPDPDLLRDINERRAELCARRQDLETQLDAAEARIHAAPNPELIDVLPVTRVDLDQLPEQLARDLLEALRLKIHYNKTTNQARCRITLSGTTVAAAQNAARRIASAARPTPGDPNPARRIRRRRFESNPCGAPGRIRTCDARFRKPMLYPLSYEGRTFAS